MGKRKERRDENENEKGKGKGKGKGKEKEGNEIGKGWWATNQFLYLLPRFSDQPEIPVNPNDMTLFILLYNIAIQ